MRFSLQNYQFEPCFAPLFIMQSDTHARLPPQYGFTLKMHRIQRNSVGFLFALNFQREVFVNPRPHFSTLPPKEKLNFHSDSI